MEIRHWLSKLLVKWAYKLHKESLEVKKFRTQMLFDAAVTGKSIMRIDPMEFNPPVSETDT